MIRRAVIYSGTVLAMAVLALLAFWHWGQVLNVYEHILDNADWIASSIVVLFALALLVCRWWRGLCLESGGNLRMA